MCSDIEIIRTLDDGLPAKARPWREAAQKLGVSEDELVARLRKMQRDGMIKRVGASINYHKAGWRANAMAAWLVPKNDIERAGAAAAEFDEVSHCYERETAPDWSYNLYTMVHARDADELAGVLRRLEAAIAPEAKIVLHTLHEFKKSRQGLLPSGE